MSKSKATFILISLAALGASIWVYINQKNGRGSQSAQTHVKARLLGYELIRYRHDDLIARTSGKKATLRDNGKLICEDRVKAVRIRDGVREELEADRADVTFPPDTSLTSKNSTIESVELTGSVEFLRGVNRFQTDWVLYTEKTGDVFSDKPVRFESEDQLVAAEGGMTYNMRQETLRMRGGVFGSVQSDVVQSGLRDASKEKGTNKK